MTPAEAIIKRLGGTRAAARLLGKSPSTVQDWKRSGLIPAKHQSEVFTRANKAEVKIDAQEFLFAPTPAEAAPAAAQRISPQVDHPTQSAVGPR